MAIIVNGYTLDGEWETSTCGQRATATRPGSSAKFFLKKYQNPVQPQDNGTLDPKTMKVNQAAFDKFFGIRKKINETIRTMTSSGGDIIIPVAEFIYDFHYVEVSQWIDGAVKDEKLEDTINSLDLATRKRLLITATGALMSIHRKNIVHSDLKLKNILIVNTGGTYSAKLIDFDNSYFLDNIPDSLGGDENYLSPELSHAVDVRNAEGDYDEEADYLADKREADKALSTKSDIFSLGLIFHFYLSGEKIGYANLNDKLKKRIESGKKIPPYVVLNHDGTLVISSKITSPNLRGLLEDMLQKDYTKRPDINQVFMRLRKPDDAPSRPEPPKPVEHEKKVDPVPPRPKKEAGYCAPWPEDKITFDLSRMASFKCVEQATVSGVKGYNLYTNLEGAPRFMTADKLVQFKFATKGSGPAPVPPKPVDPDPKPDPVPEPKKEIEPGICEPYPEDNVIFDEAAINAKGFIRVEQATRGGMKGYLLYTASGAEKFFPVATLKLLKFAKPK